MFVENNMEPSPLAVIALILVIFGIIIFGTLIVMEYENRRFEREILLKKAKERARKRCEERKAQSWSIE